MHPTRTFGIGLAVFMSYFYACHYYYGETLHHRALGVSMMVLGVLLALVPHKAPRG